MLERAGRLNVRTVMAVVDVSAPLPLRASRNDEAQTARVFNHASALSMSF